MMPKFRKKPVVIEAFQMKPAFWDDENSDHPEWAQEALDKDIIYLNSEVLDGCFVKTLEGDHKALWGDWIIQGVKGELYPCKPDIFAMTYEAVE